MSSTGGSISRVLPIASATFYDLLAKCTDPSHLSDRTKRDAQLKPEIALVFEENLSVYGVRNVFAIGLERMATRWQIIERREGCDMARCTVVRMMKYIGIEGVVRGKTPKTTIPDKALPSPLDEVNRPFHAPGPNVLWGRPWLRHWAERPMDDDFTYVATWQGFVYVAFVIDVFARRIVG